MIDMISILVYNNKVDRFFDKYTKLNISIPFNLKIPIPAHPTMYQQKFMPYNQMNDVYEQDEFQEEDSEPLVEEVDPDYEPTEKQVRQYAIEILGMKLPEDQRLIYLAREGLKAPIPTNWQPFQGRDGQVYYKHKITQEKTYEHPTDIEYRKKYIQEKQRSARKNLKSMSLKANLSGLGQPLGHQPLGGFGQKGINPLGLSNPSQSVHNLSKEVSKLDPRLQEQLQQQLQELEERLKMEFEQFEEDCRQKHEKNMKKYKSEFETSLSEMTSQKSSVSSNQKAMKQEKQRIKQRLKQAYDDRFKIEFSDVQKIQENKYQEFVQLYQEDNKIKLKKYQGEKQRQYTERVKRLENQERRHQENKKQKQKERERIISQVREKYQQENNEQIQQATRETFHKEIQAIKESNVIKVKEFEQRLQTEFSEMRKLLGHDPHQALQQLAEKKNRLKKMSQQKIESMKKKQYQKVSQDFTQNLQKQLKQVQTQLEQQNTKQMEKQKFEKSEKRQQMKRKLQNQVKEKLQKKVEQIYSQVKRSTTEYQKQKNKKILQIRQKFISQMVEKKDSMTEQINIRLNVKDKQQMIQNKQQLIQSLKRQLQLQSFVLKQLRINKSIAYSSNIDAQLKKLLTQLHIVYKPDEFLKHQKKFNLLKHKYKADKLLLASMMSQLQNSSYINFYDRHNVGGSSTTSALVKMYNQDVRTMRINQQMLGKYELLLRKAQLNDQEAIQLLESQDLQYEQISVRSTVGLLPNEANLQEINNVEEGQTVGKVGFYGVVSNSYQSIEDRLKSHSKFLSNIKAQLNRKLYKVRSNNYFRV